MHLRHSSTNNQPQLEFQQDWQMQNLEEIQLSEIADKFGSTSSVTSNSSTNNPQSSEFLSTILENSSKQSTHVEGGRRGSGAPGVFSTLFDHAKQTSAFYVIKFWANVDSLVLDDCNASFFSSIELVLFKLRFNREIRLTGILSNRYIVGPMLSVGIRTFTPSVSEFGHVCSY